MSSNGSDYWYLIRTKPGKERWVRDQLAPRLTEVFLPMLKARMPRWGRHGDVGGAAVSVLFVRAPDLQSNYFEVKYLAGVRGWCRRAPILSWFPKRSSRRFVPRGSTTWSRSAKFPFDSGQPVRVVEGPFRGFEAIFERYLSSAERVAILLNTIENAGPRIVLPASALAKYT